MNENGYLSIDDLYRLKSVTDPQFSPDGTKCLFVQTEMSREKDEYVSHLYMMDLESDSPPKQWTFGNGRNRSPRWSPDGSKIAFVSNRSGRNQIFIMDTAGGEAKQITFFKHGAMDPVWGPEGERIACSVKLSPLESLQQTETDSTIDEVPQPIVVDQMKYKSDGSGIWDGKYKQIVVIGLQGGKTALLTNEQTDSTFQCWSPDGKSIVFSSERGSDRDQSFKSDLFLLHLETGQLECLTNGNGYFGKAAFSPDGKYLGYIGHEREFENASLSNLWIVDMSNRNLTCATEYMDLYIGDVAIGDFQQGADSPGLIWGEDGESFYFMASDQGNTAIYFGNMSGEMYPALLGSQHVYGYTLHPKSQRIIAAISTPTLPGELFHLVVPTGEMSQLTFVNQPLTDSIELSKPEELYIQAEDGIMLSGWIMKPTECHPEKKYPLILEIHGGPHMMYANTYMHEFQVLAANGYAVLYLNPRGSHGYGQSFVNAVRGDYGGMDYKDLMKAVDEVINEYDFIDNQRLGVTGGSYGGFMTNWIIGHTDRFKAAVTQRSISNWISFYGVSDIGYYFTKWQMKAELDDIQTLWKHSPLAYVKNVKTPLLILHSEKDHRCPIEQAEQLYIALKNQRKATRFIRFPESNHELSRSGKPSLRIKRLTYILDWFHENL